MSAMDSTTPASGHEPIPVNRFALFSETLLAGLLVLVLSIPLVTIPAAYAAGTAHLERHLAGRDDSVRGLWSLFKAALPGSWKLGIATAAAAVVIVLNLLLAWVGQLPGRGVVLPATLALAAGAAILLLRTASAWTDTTGQGTSAVDSWRAALHAGQAISPRDWTGSLLLAAALFCAVVFVWMLAALFVVVPGTLILAAAAVKLRSGRPRR
ncbi:Poxvirus protein I5 [Pseudarthrobacter sp. fls2-241-R2A-127]|uniref:Poxvirus protein I5 n=1 Tax=Pseudarthrobacter sp. fls2-241-R2A-127 TaxID=3040303 RepID=UPI002557BB75|nr:Poxvirus protein I5 [Pseudarthrobacter sp. fls2-241-R2A-127]